jgi:hypothetical protein
MCGHVVGSGVRRRLTRRLLLSVRRASSTTTPTPGGTSEVRCTWRWSTSTASIFKRSFREMDEPDWMRRRPAHANLPRFYIVAIKTMSLTAMVKPANVVLRNDDLTAPVLVDFGLSFNDSDEDDLTRVNEEVGNRFLRLPEHAFGGSTRKATGPPPKQDDGLMATTTTRRWRCGRPPARPTSCSGC